ncbi:MAG: nucleotidyltransferase family protein, partial [Candidatus Kariarchaeaceae archaeon]
MSEVQAILFSGGKGTRLYPITNFYQKVMMPMGETGHPMLEFIIRHLAYYGITNIIALIGYRANQIRRYFGDGSRFDVNIEYVVDSPKHKGTGGALLNAADSISGKSLLIYYTDILSNIDLSRFIDFHMSASCLGTAWIDPSWHMPEGVIKKDDMNEISSIENNQDKILANTGISLLDADILNTIIDLYNSEKGNLDLSGEVFPDLVDKGEMKAYLSDEWWVDIGSMSRHQRINEQILERKFSHIWNILN